MRFLPGAALLMAVVSACDAAGPADGRVVEGVDFDRLFAPPTVAELGAVERDWAARDVSVQGYEAVLTRDTTAGGERVTVRVVSHTVGGVRHYGGLVAPPGAAPGSLPVLLYLHGGDGGVGLDEEVLLALSLAPGLAREFVLVIPSFRSEALRFAGRAYRSEGPPSPWDRDVDDALALLNVALETTPAADAGRIGVLGFSRGAAVGLLMGARDPRVRMVVEFFGPTDFLGAFSQRLVEDALLGRATNLPGVGYLNQAFVQPLKQQALSIEDVRLELIRRSAVHFARRLPQVQVHHGTADDVVPVSEAHALDAAMRALGRTAPAYEFYLYEGGIHFPLALPGSLDRAMAFLGRLSSQAAAARLAQHGAPPAPAWRRTGS